MIVEITDDFDLQKIAESGQCFRVKQFNDGSFRFITKDFILYISKVSDSKFSISCTEDEWRTIWVPYFDLTRCYHDLEHLIPDTDSFLVKAYKEGQGIRILTQDHWETLISFIISQRKSIPSIKCSIELISMRFGKPITTPRETIYTFPTPEEMASSEAGLADLRNCKVGYRDEYIVSAMSQIIDGTLSLDSIESLSNQALFHRLLEIRGVGKKVANCVCLFSYNRTSLAPVDTWIQKVIDIYYGGDNPLDSYENVAGIMQQYIFYYTQKHKEEFKHGQHNKL